MVQRSLESETRLLAETLEAFMDSHLALIVFTAAAASAAAVVVVMRRRRRCKRNE
jgi:hypothetical protein